MTARTYSAKVFATTVAFSSLFIAGFIGTVVSLSHFRPANAYNDYDFICGWTYGGGYSALSLPYRTDPDFPAYGYYTTMLASAIQPGTEQQLPWTFIRHPAEHIRLV